MLRWAKAGEAGMTGLPPAYRPPVILEVGGLKQNRHSPSGCFAFFAVRFRASSTRPAQKQKPPLRGGCADFVWSG